MTPALAVTSWIWLALEITLRVRDHRRATGSTARDRGTRRLTVLLILPAVLLANLIPILVDDHGPLRMSPGPAVPAAGLALMWLGLVVRTRAVMTLGASFRTTVEVDDDQAVVDRGVYRWIRHPSYAGVLLITTGYGLALDDWIALALLVAVPAVAITRRIAVEEEALLDTLGRPYETYRRRTHRLAPGIW